MSAGARQYFDGCRTYEGAELVLERRWRGMDASVELVAVNTDEDAERLKFPGSPTLRADGEDLLPVPDHSARALGCRAYLTPDGLKGHPTAEMIAEALNKKGEFDAKECL